MFWAIWAAIVLAAAVVIGIILYGTIGAKKVADTADADPGDENAVEQYSEDKGRSDRAVG